MGIFNIFKFVGGGRDSEKSHKSFDGSSIPPGRMKETDKIKGPESTIPNKRGVYRHIDKETGTINYIGQTDNLRRRQQEHHRTGKLDLSKQKVAYSVCKDEATKDDLLRTEKKQIKRHNPTGNITKGGNGRR